MIIQDLKRFVGRIQKARLLPLLLAAAESLTDRPVQVNLQAPVFKGFAGHAYRTESGFAVDIDPAAPGGLKRFFWTFLHEVGHLHLGHCDDELPFGDLVPVELADLVKRRELEMAQLFRDAYDADQDGHEAAANNFAQQIGSYAREKALNKFGSDEIEACLQILSNTRIIPEVKR